MRTLRNFFRRRVIAPFLLAEAPRGHLSRAAGIGLFVALLPIVGQLYLVPGVWALLRAFPRLRFNLPAALAMVVLVNPPSKVLLFYGYILTGEALLDAAGVVRATDNRAFRAGMAAMDAAPWSEWLDHAGRLIGLAFERYGLPLAVGGSVWAVVLGTAAGAGTAYLLTRRRRQSENGERSDAAEPS